MTDPVIVYELAEIAARRSGDATEYAAPTPGQVAKVMFDFSETDGTPVGSESMWVEVTEATSTWAPGRGWRAAPSRSGHPHHSYSQVNGSSDSVRSSLYCQSIHTPGSRGSSANSPWKARKSSP